MAPTLFIVPGYYEGPAAFEPLVEVLGSKGCSNVHTTQVRSCGTTSKSEPLVTLDDDVAAIAADMTRVVEAAGEDGVILLLHSAGGFLGGAAMKGLAEPSRKAVGKPGGVREIIFLAAGIFPEGSPQMAAPWMVFDHDKGTQICGDLVENMFHDLPEEQAKAWADRMQPHPDRGWDRIITHCGWKDVPSYWVLTEQDRLIPPPLQEQLAQMSESKIIRLQSGHMVQLSNVDAVAGIVADVVEGRA